jgi:DNA-binding XRE family transcriptional regulator
MCREAEAQIELSRRKGPPISQQVGDSQETKVNRNNVKVVREALMMSKAELARRAGLSTLTIDRVEAGKSCRLDTMRKILHALGMKVSDKDRVFGALELENFHFQDRLRNAADSSY